MSEFAIVPQQKTDEDFFPSFAALRSAHSELLKLHRDKGNELEVLTKIKQLIHKGRETGALLDSDSDRDASQSLLDYWSSLLYRAGQEPPDATLRDFDSSLAPDLSEDLCPYVGLAAFRENNQSMFFGRQRLIDKLLKHLEINRCLIVVGSSGSGKSSVVLGGLLPRLVSGALPSSQDWIYYDPIVPSTDPLIAIARRLEPADANVKEWISEQVLAFKQNPNHLVQLLKKRNNLPVVLVIDQFEEVFTLCQDDVVRQALVKNLLNFIHNPDARNILVLTMRTDFESQFVRIPDLLTLFEQSNIRVDALDAGELRETIEKPAEMVGLKFEEGLVDKLMGDVLGEPAALPLLQFTLLKLWESREHNRVTWEAYRQLGGGRLALARSADEFYNKLIPQEQYTVKRILLRMVRPSDGLEVTSNRILRKELYRSGEATDQIDIALAKLIKERLVRLTMGDTPENTQVEIAHEALIRNWPRLVEWLDQERINIRQRLRLTATAEQWQSRKRDRSILMRGDLLKEVQLYEDLNDLELTFIRCSKRAEIRKQSVLGISILVIVIMLSCLSIFGFSEAEKAKSEKLEKEQLLEDAKKELAIRSSIIQFANSETARLTGKNKSLEEELKKLLKEKNIPPVAINENKMNATVAGSPDLERNVREGAGTTYKVIGKLKGTDRVKIIKSEIDSGGYPWYQIPIQNPEFKGNGWIAGHLVNPD